MKLSARNVLKGIVRDLDVGAVNVEVSVEVAPGVTMTSVITKKSSDNLGLEIGKEVFAIVKASNVMIGTD